MLDAHRRPKPPLNVGRRANCHWRSVMGRLMRSKQTRRCWSKTCKLCDGMGGRRRRRWLILQTPKQFLRIANSIWDTLSSGIISKRAVTTSVFFSRKRSCDSGQPMCEPKRSNPAVGLRLMSTGNADRSVSLGQNSSHFSKFTSKPDCFPSVVKFPMLLVNRLCNQ